MARSTRSGADISWARNTHPAPRAPYAVTVPITDDFGFARARTAREHFEALILKFEFERRAAQLLNVAEVKIAAARVRHHFQRSMLAIPTIVAPQLAAETDELRVHGQLSAAIRLALIDFADQCEAGRISGAPESQGA